MIDTIVMFLTSIINLLPNSPFNGLIPELIETEWIAYMNWFIPFGFISRVLSAWLVCILGYYIYKKTKSIIDVILGKLSA